MEVMKMKKVEFRATNKIIDPCWVGIYRDRLGERKKRIKFGYL